MPGRIYLSGPYTVFGIANEPEAPTFVDPEEAYHNTFCRARGCCACRVAVGGAVSPALVAEARGWLKDCQWRNMEPEDFDELAPEEVVAGVERHYGGGWAQFARDAEGVVPDAA